MILAALRDTGYNIVLLIHVLTVIVATTGAVAHPLMFALERRRPDPDPAALAQRFEIPSRIYAISFAITGLVGFGLISMGDWPWGDAWLWLSIVVWVAANGVLHAMLLPAERAVAGGDTSAARRLDIAGPLTTALVLVVLFLMVVKPGGSAL